MDSPRYREREWRDRRIEADAVVGQHLVTALHSADRRFEDSATRVAESLARLQVRLLADDTLAANFLDLARSEERRVGKECRL